MKHFGVLMVLAMMLGGCTRLSTSGRTARDARIVFQVVKASEHLGHSTDAEGGHAVWCDGSRGRLADTGEDFVVWWSNNEIKDTPYRFEGGKTYTIQFKGALDDGIMGYEGRCLHISGIVQMRENDD